MTTETPPRPSPADASWTLRRRLIFERLSGSRLYREYKSAFEEATGLPLTFRAPGAYVPAGEGSGRANAFCVLLSSDEAGCVECREVQSALEGEAREGPGILECFAGLREGAVPVRVGEETVGFLQTGQVLGRPPSRGAYDRVALRLRARGAAVDLDALEAAYFGTRVVGGGRHGAILRLLSAFAEQLAAAAGGMELGACVDEPALVAEAKRYIGERYAGRISLDAAARAVNASTRHFCKVFKKATGITFTDYLARVRVEKAKGLLRNPHLRVSEAAFETGFESISQFNRSFKRVTGMTPTQYREEF